MADPLEVAEYDQAGASVQLPVHDCNAVAMSSLLPREGMLLDLGCGSARQLVRVGLGRSDAELVGVDLSAPMLDAGRRLAAEAGVADRIELCRADFTRPDLKLARSREPSLVCSCLALHQLPSEDLVLCCLKQIRRLREQTGCGVYVFDLVRLRHTGTWPAMLSLAVLPGEAFRADAIASERAAFTFAEMVRLIDQAGLDDLRHARAGALGEYQLHWAPGRGLGAPGRWQAPGLPLAARPFAWSLRRSFPRALMRDS